MIEIDFDWFLPPGWLIAASALVIAMVTYSGVRLLRRLPRRRALTLTALKLLTAGLLLTALAAPVVRIMKSDQTRRVAILVDNSRSMTVEDSFGGNSRIATAAGTAAEIADRLKGGFRTDLFVFGSRLDRIDDFSRARGDEKFTDIAGALAGLDAETYSALVLISDGIEHSANPAIPSAPVFTVAVGSDLSDTGAFCDVLIETVNAPKEAVIGTAVGIEVEAVALGDKDFVAALAGKKIEFSVDGKAYAGKDWEAYSPRARTTFEWVPEKTGLHKLTIGVPTIEGELTNLNNERRIVVNVTDPQYRVLYVEGAMRHEAKFLLAELLTDPNIKLTSLIRVAPERFVLRGEKCKADLSRGLPKDAGEYAEFDAVILGSVAGDAWDDVILTLLEKYVADGGTLVALGGEASLGLGGWNNTRLEDLAPVKIDADERALVAGAGEIAFTPAGENHPALAGLAAFVGKTGGIAIESVHAYRDVKRGAETLATAGGYVLAAVQKYGQGRVFLVATNTTWKWRFSNRQDLQSFYAKFWRQLTRWAANVSETDTGLALEIPRRVFLPGQDVKIRLTLGREIEAPLDYSARLDLTDPEAKKISAELKRADNAPRIWTAAFRPEKNGDYALDAAALGRDRKSFSATEVFTVQDTGEEMARLATDRQFLRDLSQRARGADFDPRQIDQLVRAVAQQVQTAPVVAGGDIFSSFWPFFALLAILSLEWIVRRRSNLF